MKRAQSDLITSFLRHVEGGTITGQTIPDDSDEFYVPDAFRRKSGSEVLAQLCDALRAIRDGADPDDALQITRAAGAPSDPVNAALAFLIHQWRKADVKWSVIEKQANDWLRENDRDGVSEARLKTIYKNHRERLEAFDDIKRMAHLTEQSRKKK